MPGRYIGVRFDPAGRLDSEPRPAAALRRRSRAGERRSVSRDQEKYPQSPARTSGQTHIPDWIASRVLNQLPADDARLLAQIINEHMGDTRCYFFNGEWVVDSLFPKKP